MATLVRRNALVDTTKCARHKHGPVELTADVTSCAWRENFEMVAILLNMISNIISWISTLYPCKIWRTIAAVAA